MKKTETFCYSKHIFLDKSRMKELHILLMKHCDRLELSVKTIGNSKIEFDSFEELMEYSNFKNGRIHQLNIYGYLQNSEDRIIDLTFSEDALKALLGIPPVICTYKFAQQGEDILFCTELKNIFDKAKLFHIHEGIFVTLLPVLWMFLLYVFSPDTFSDTVTLSIVIVIIVLTAFMVIISFLLFMKLYPTVYFSWGEAIMYYKNIIKWRNFLFFSVFLTIVLGILANYISRLLFQ